MISSREDGLLRAYKAAHQEKIQEMERELESAKNKIEMLRANVDFWQHQYAWAKAYIVELRSKLNAIRQIV